jgi:hypothetical protein
MDKLCSGAIIDVRKNLMNNSDSKLLTLSQLALVFVGITSSFFASANIVPPLSAAAQPSSISSSQNLSSNPGNSTDAQIAVYQNNVYLVWSDATTGNGDIYFKRSVDNGTSFGTTENLSINSTESSSGPQISAVGGNVYLAWTEPTKGNNEVLFRYSNDSGVSFRGEREISNTLSLNGDYALFPTISAIGSNVYVVWQDKVSGNYEILLRESNDGGNRFSGIKNLSRNNTGDSISPRIVSSGNNVYVAWTDHEPGKNEIFLRASNDNAATFGGIKNVSWSDGDSYDPKIAVAGNSSLYVLWEDSSYRDFTFDLIFRASDNAADTFRNKVNIGRYVGEIADYGQIAGTGNNIFVIWSEAPRYSYPPLYKIFLEASRDSGKSFDDAINLSPGPGNSIDPQIAVSEENKTVFVVWSEVTNGNSEIQFVKIENFF